MLLGDEKRILTTPRMIRPTALLARPLNLVVLALLLLFALTSLHYSLGGTERRPQPLTNQGSAFKPLFDHIGIHRGSERPGDRQHVQPLPPGIDMQEETPPPPPAPPPPDPEVLVAPEPGPNAYVFYATTDLYACSALVNIDRLQRQHKTKYRIFVIGTKKLSSFYLKAFADRFVTVTIQDVPPLGAGGIGYYEDCFVKLLAFKMHHIDPSLRRIIVMDSDQLILAPLDSLFESLPVVDLAAPRAYWIAKDALMSAFMMINLSDRLWNTIQKNFTNLQTEKYDMDIINDVLGDTALVLPGAYSTLNSHWEAWDLPTWYHPEEDMSKITKEEPKYPDFKGADTLDVNDVPPGADTRRRRRRADTDEDDAEYEAATKGSESDGLPISSNELDTAAIAPPASGNTASIPPASGDTPSTPAAVTPRIGTPAGSTGVKIYKTKEERPLFEPLKKFQESAIVVHFFALGKPWSYTEAQARVERPDAHPVFYQQFKEWREAAKNVCWRVVDEV